MENRFEMRFTGSGGQGVILASVIFAEAAVMSEMNAIQSQAYGPEARGGMCKAELILSHEPIWFSKVTCPNFVLALTQKSLDEYSRCLAEDAIVIADSSLSMPELAPDKRVLTAPILDGAANKVGKAMTANIVAIGAINKALNLFDEDILKEAVRLHIPKGTEEINMLALSVGSSMVDKEIAEKFKVKVA